MDVDAVEVTDRRKRCGFFLFANKLEESSTSLYEYVRASSSSFSSASSPATDHSAQPSPSAHPLAAVSRRVTNVSSQSTPPFGGLPWRLHRIHFLNEQHEYRMTSPSVEYVCYRKQLFVSVQVRATATERRDAIRSTWAAEMPDAVILRFFVCGAEVNKQQHLFQENRRHGDIVFCDLPDDYFKMHLKVDRR
ncbi:hypothetical protein AAVH_11124 [Aphelenchoides avenae]|nr:hypothetical protein AAVH_11124 [Aphelenchus avenae]